MSQCEIDGEVIVREVEIGRNSAGIPATVLVWERADPEIHVAVEMLEFTAARRALEERYDVGEFCPHHPRARHARRRPDAPPLDDGGGSDQT